MLGTGTMSRRSGTCRTSSPNSTPRMPGRVGSRVSRCRHGRWVAAITFDAADLPEDVVALVDAHLLDLGGTYGVPEVGDRAQYDELRIEHDQGEVEIVVYNRAILLFFTDSEAVRRIRMEWAGPTGASVPAARAAPATPRDGSQRRAGRDFWLRWATVRAPSILRSHR